MMPTGHFYFTTRFCKILNNYYNVELPFCTTVIIYDVTTIRIAQRSTKINQK